MTLQGLVMENIEVLEVKNGESSDVFRQSDVFYADVVHSSFSF